VRRKLTLPLLTPNDQVNRRATTARSPRTRPEPARSA